MQTPHFLILDSGIGGLSILKEIQMRIPHCTATYLADNAAFPYGTKEESELIDRLLYLLPLLESNANPDIIVVACNTVSTLLLDQLRKTTSTPIIGVVPAIKPAAQISQSKHIALLATPGTIKRPYTDRLIKDFASHCQVLKLASDSLVHEAEKKLRGDNVNLAVIEESIAPLLHAHSVDTLILGCTHFPFLREEFQRSLPSTLRIIDSGEAIARRAAQLLTTINVKQTLSSKNRFLLTGKSLDAQRLCLAIAPFDFEDIQLLGDSTT